MERYGRMYDFSVDLGPHAEILDDLTTELISQDKLSHYLKDPTLEPDMQISLSREPILNK